jgi:hypothetical protein
MREGLEQPLRCLHPIMIVPDAQYGTASRTDEASPPPSDLDVAKFVKRWETYETHSDLAKRKPQMPESE